MAHIVMDTVDGGDLMNIETNVDFQEQYLDRKFLTGEYHYY